MARAPAPAPTDDPAALADAAARATGADRHPRGLPGIANADEPSLHLATGGLPDVGAGASASHFARDAGPLQEADEDRRGEGPGTSDKRAEG